MTTTKPIEKTAQSETPKIIPKKKIITKSIAEAKLFIKSTFNNTLVTVTDLKGNTLTWSSSGRCGFKGSRKSTPFAATTAIERALEEAKKYGIKTANLKLLMDIRSRMSGTKIHAGIGFGPLVGVLP